MSKEVVLQMLRGEPLQAELDAAKRHIGELSMDVELLMTKGRGPQGSPRGIAIPPYPPYG